MAWFFTTIGFFSVTEPRDGDGKTLQVRARVLSDLTALRKQFLPELGSIRSKIGTDYPYRSFISKEDFALGMARIVLSIDYSNFKATVDKKQGLAREQLYMKVWQVMRDAEAKLEKMDAANQLVYQGRSQGTFWNESDRSLESGGGGVPTVPIVRGKKKPGVRGRKRRKS